MFADLLLLFPVDAEPTEEDTIQFELKVKCTRNQHVKEATDPDDLYKDHKGNWYTIIVVSEVNLIVHIIVLIHGVIGRVIFCSFCL